MGWFDDVTNAVQNPIGTVQNFLDPAGLTGGGGIGGIGNMGLSGLTDPLTGASATQAAINAQRDATNQANQIQQDVYNSNKQTLQPWQQAGQSGLNQLQSAMPDLTKQFSASDYQQSPGYQFQLQQGQQAIERSAAAKGLLSSTGTMKNLDSYSQGLANQDYQQAYNNFTNNQQQKYGMLSGLANYGQNANAQLVGAGQNYANQVGQNDMGMGNAAAAAQIGQANRVSGLIGNGITGGAMALSGLAKAA